MEKIPGLRIVGDASIEARGLVKEMMESRLTDHVRSLSEKDREFIARHEYPKTEQELALIDFANAETNRLREEAGVEPYDIPAANYHLVPDEGYVKIMGEQSSCAAAFFDRQGIVFKAESFRNNPVYFGSVALHESLHLKGHLAIEVEKSARGTSMKTYREGVTVHASQKKKSQGMDHRHFFGLHEAIVSVQQKRSMPNLLALPMLNKEKKRLSSEEAKSLLKRVSRMRGIPEGDFIWVGENESEYDDFSYRSQCEVLQYVCDEIQVQFPERYSSAEEVFSEFLKAQFTGRLLPIARLVEGTFGKEGFRRLGDMKTDDESGVLTLEAMKKMRTRNKK